MPNQHLRKYQIALTRTPLQLPLSRYAPRRGSHRVSASSRSSPPHPAATSAAEAQSGSGTQRANSPSFSNNFVTSPGASAGRQQNPNHQCHPHVPQHRHLQPPDPCDLLKDITSSLDLSTLLEVLDNNEPYLNVRHLDAALNRLARLAISISDSNSSRDHGNMPTSSSPPFSPTTALATARATARRLLSSVLPAHTTSLSPRDSASVLSSLSRLQLPPPPPLLPLLQDALLQQLPAASLRDRVQFLHACAKLRLPLPEGAVSELLLSLDGQLGQYGKPQDISMALWALARLGARPQPAWLARLRAALPPARLAAFGSQALANTVWALAAMGWAPGTRQAAMHGRGSGRRWDWGPGAEERWWVRELLCAAVPVLPGSAVQEVCNLLWAVAVMRLRRPPREWVGAVLGRLAELAAQLTAQDVAHVCWSLGVLRVRPGRPLLQALVARALAVRCSSSAQWLVLTLWGLSRLGVVLPERAVAALLQGGMGEAALAAAAAAAAAGTSTPAAASVTPASEGDPMTQDAAASEGSGVRQDGDVTAAAAPVAAAPPTPGDLAGAALVLSRCRHVPPRRWLVRYYSAVAACRQRFHPSELSTLLYGIAGLGLRPGGHWLDLLLTEVERCVVRHTDAAAAAVSAEARQQQPLAAPPPMSPSRLCLPPPRPPPLLQLPLQPLSPSEPTAPQQPPSGAQGADLSPFQHQQEQQQQDHHRHHNHDQQQQQRHAYYKQRQQQRRGPRRLWAPRPPAHSPGSPQQLQAGEVAVVLWAVARLGHAPAPAWLARMARAVAARAEEFSPSEAAACMCALNQLALAAAARSTQERTAGRGALGRRRRRRRRLLLVAPAAAVAEASSGHSVVQRRTAVASSDDDEDAVYDMDELVGGLVARLAGNLSERCLYGTLRAAALARGVSYATAADQPLLEVYSVKSLGLLSGRGW